MNIDQGQNTIEITTELCALLIATEMVTGKVDETDLKILLSLGRRLAHTVWDNLNDAGFGE
ncbi:hypothetical protein [Klebsiella pneumoniae]|uniref:hypothetical protein n=1 Tax=Klebsiella pneumoniae TaxID=573 RepID=UPI0027314F30|nr:hypothetical protein [Klebsiella pneumoniae]MCP6657076.1 hypothetical protein [Klebsiella pneumoniae]MDP1193750.1 hypothetical protein [Klebsiella pneumoniae]MDP1216428.1 hypothetical protein [Klebsiella pneumoniae]